MINCCNLAKFGLALILSGATAGFTLRAQEVVRPGLTNAEFLQKNAAVMLNKALNAKLDVLEVAQRKGWALSQRDGNGNTMRLQRMDDLGLPVYYTTTNNIIAAGTTRTNQLYQGGSLGLSLNGSTIPAGKVAIWDSDAVLGSHVEFSGSRIEVRDKTTTTALHSTHVGGTMIAAGVNASARGMAFGLSKLYSFNFDNDTPEMSANAAALLISNHSYGAAAGWSLNTDVSPQRWEFFGAPGANEDYKFGYYDTESSEWDKICYNAPYYLPVKSAGNNRSVNGPAIGNTYYRYNEDRVMSNAGARPPGISSNDGYDNIATYGTAKNILTVGAINPLPSGPYEPDHIQITAFSSWGPTDDGRIKPDLVADGIRVVSTSNAGNNSYASLSGTSMATPNVSGSLILLQELYSKQYQGNYMRSATLKGLAIGTAAEAGSAEGPDYSYGWGLLNMEAAAQAILNNGVTAKIAENVLLQGEQQFIDVKASGKAPLIATLCWTDPEAVAISSLSGLNNSSPRLVNDLDLRATDASTIYRPWVLDPANPSAAASTGDNTRDNVEQIKIDNATAGTVYRINVSHKATLKRGGQAYSLVITGINGPAELTTEHLSATDSQLNLLVFPVPAKNELNVSFNVINNTSLTIRLINISGQVLQEEEKNSFSGIYQRQFDLTTLSSGMYFIVVKAAGKTYTKKFICVK